MLMWLSKWLYLLSLLLCKRSFISQLDHTAWICFWNFTMSLISSHPHRNGTGSQTTWPVLLYRTKPVSTAYSSAMVHPSVLSDDITSTISPFPDPTEAFFFILAMENKWLKPISYFLEAIHMDCNDITPEACHSRHNFPGCLAKEPDSGVMLMKLCGHIQMAA